MTESADTMTHYDYGQPPDDNQGPPDQQQDDMSPQNVEAEAGMVGLFLIDSRGLSVARAMGLESEHFYDRRIGMVYDAILDLKYVEGELVDQIAVGEHLKRQGKLAEAGGIVQLSEMAAQRVMVGSSQVKRYTEIIIEAAAGRAALEDAAELRGRIMAGEAANSVLADVSHKLQRRRVGGVVESWRSCGELLDELDAQYDIAKRRGGEWAGLNTGIPKLNDLTSGLCPEELTFIGARPNIGKSTLMLRIATTVAEAGHSVAVFSLEMSKVQCMQRLACIEANVDLRRFRSGRMDLDEIERYGIARRALAHLPLYFDHTPSLSVAELQARYDRLKDQRGEIPLVLVDFVQLMGGSEDPRVTEAQRFTDIAKHLQAFTKTQQVHTLAASQLSRGPEARDDRRPRLSDLRESGGLEQAADNVWLIHRPGHYSDLKKKAMKDGMSEEAFYRWVEIIAAKTKFGPTGIVHMDWLMDTGEFGVPGEERQATMEQADLPLPDNNRRHHR
jgi:replicative DNA helicase